MMKPPNRELKFKGLRSLALSSTLRHNTRANAECTLTQAQIARALLSLRHCEGKRKLLGITLHFDRMLEVRIPMKHIRDFSLDIENKILPLPVYTPMGKGRIFIRGL